MKPEPTPRHPLTPSVRALDRPLHLLLISRIKGSGIGHVDVAQGRRHVVDARRSTRDPAAKSDRLE